MTGMREMIAGAHFEMQRARNLQNLVNMAGGRALRTWHRDDRAQYRAIKRTTWENLEQRDRDEYLGMADIALICLLKPTPAMIDAGYDGDPADSFRCSIQAARDGK